MQALYTAFVNKDVPAFQAALDARSLRELESPASWSADGAIEMRRPILNYMIVCRCDNPVAFRTKETLCMIQLLLNRGVHGKTKCFFVEYCTELASNDRDLFELLVPYVPISSWFYSIDNIVVWPWVIEATSKHHKINYCALIRGLVKKCHPENIHTFRIACIACVPNIPDDATCNIYSNDSVEFALVYWKYTGLRFWDNGVDCKCLNPRGKVWKRRNRIQKIFTIMRARVVPSDMARLIYISMC
jgi:hypothetical protein